jgi:hypothetical protein
MIEWFGEALTPRDLPLSGVRTASLLEPPQGLARGVALCVPDFEAVLEYEINWLDR